MATGNFTAAQSGDRRRIPALNGDSRRPLIAVMIVTNGRSGVYIIAFARRRRAYAGHGRGHGSIIAVYL